MTGSEPDDAARWREAAELRGEHPQWVIIWLAPSGRFRAYRRLPGARRDTALTDPAAAGLAAQITQRGVSPFVVLDAAAFDILGTPRDTDMRALLRRTAERGGRVCCAAVTLAEVCRGMARTRHAEAALARSHGGQRIRVVATDERLGKLVGGPPRGSWRL